MNIEHLLARVTDETVREELKRAWERGMPARVVKEGPGSRYEVTLTIERLGSLQEGFKGYRARARILTDDLTPQEVGQQVVLSELSLDLEGFHGLDPEKSYVTELLRTLVTRLASGIKWEEQPKPVDLGVVGRRARRGSLSKGQWTVPPAQSGAPGLDIPLAQDPANPFAQEVSELPPKTPTEVEG